MKEFNLKASNTAAFTKDSIEPITSLFESVRNGAINDAEPVVEQGGPVIGGFNI